MRNALMQRPQAAGYEQTAAPVEEPPANPLMQRRGEQPQQDPTADFMAKAQAAGVDIEGELAKGGDQTQVLMRAMKQIWAKEPTDENGEMLEELSRHLGLPPPWQQGEGMMKLGGPQEEEGRGMPSRADYEEMPPDQRGFANPELARQHGYMSEAMASEEPGAARAYGGMQPPLNRYRDMRVKR